MRKLIVAIVLLALVGCASVPKQAAPADVPIAVIGEFECGEMQGIIVVSKDGTITPIEDHDVDDLKAFLAKVPEDHIGAVNLSENCPPKQKT